VTITIEKLVYGGDGLARIDGEVVLTPFVLPGEKAEIEREPSRSGAARGRLVQLIEPAAERVKPECPYFERCGGCHYQHAAYEAQVAAKRAILAETLARVGKISGIPEIRAISSEPYGYRNRIQLHFMNGRIGYRELRSHKLCAVEVCPISSPRLDECIRALNRMVRDRAWPDFLRTAELFTNETDVQLNVIETQRPLAKRFFDWCARELPGYTPGAIDYDGFRVSYGSFFQVNRFLIRQLVDEVTAGVSGRFVVDLYAGVGLFTVALAKSFERVIAVESGSGAVRDLEANAARAGIKVEAAIESVDVYLHKLTESPDCVLADPPRTGLGRAVVKRLVEIRPRELTIVACDPATLARDARLLLDAGYRLAGLTVVDLFPQTYHIETVARFTAD
jgi:23S rRNA (uracil1939-C5)-methyltransferase